MTCLLGVVCVFLVLVNLFGIYRKNRDNASSKIMLKISASSKMIAHNAPLNGNVQLLYKRLQTNTSHKTGDSSFVC